MRYLSSVVSQAGRRRMLYARYAMRAFGNDQLFYVSHYNLYQGGRDYYVLSYQERDRHEDGICKFLLNSHILCKGS